MVLSGNFDTHESASALICITLSLETIPFSIMRRKTLDCIQGKDFNRADFKTVNAFVFQVRDCPAAR
jgi:hypothetical protein